jgi:hypothetical protein
VSKSFRSHAANPSRGRPESLATTKMLRGGNPGGHPMQG